MAAFASTPGFVAALHSAARRRRWALTERSLAAPLGLFYLVFLFAPLAALFVVSLSADRTFSRFGFSQYATFFSERLNWAILGETLELGLMCTLACLAFAYPLALVYARAPRRVRPLMRFLIVLPQLTSSVVRTFAWIVILGREGVVDSTLLSLGLPRAGLLFTTPGVVVALTQIQLPLMVLPLINAVIGLDPHLLEASQSLGAGAWRGFFRVILPLTAPAATAGALLVFTAAISAFVTQSIVGGGRLVYMPKYIYDLSIGAQDWPFAAAATMMLLAAALLAVAALSWLGGRAARRVQR